MGDIGAMLLGLMLAYGPISSTASLDPALLTNYTSPTLDRFPTFLPLLVPAAIFVIPYADLMFAIVRRTRAGKPLMAADRQHLHHRVLNIGHSYRQSVLIMYLWAALFSVTVVSLSVVRTRLIVFVVATAVAVLTLLPVTMPGLRPWRLLRQRQAVAVAARRGAAAARHGAAAARHSAAAARHGAAAARHGAAAHRGTVPATPRAATATARNGAVATGRRGTAPALGPDTGSALARPPGPVLNGAPPLGLSASGASPLPGAPLPGAPLADAASASEAAGYLDVPGFLSVGQLPVDQFPVDRLPRAGRLPGADPADPLAPAYPVDPLGPGPGRPAHPDPFSTPDPFSPPPRQDARPW
jgi:hypothetical protein